jgi:hypothetical protein
MPANNFNYNVPEQDPWANRKPLSAADAALDKLDAAGVRGVVVRAMASEEEVNASLQFHNKDVPTFLSMYPAYVNNDHNMRLMRHHWEQVLGVTIPTFEQMEESFFALRDSGVIQLNAKAVAKENEEQILRRAAELREAREANEFNEADAYTMSIEELKRRARASR